MAVKKTSNNIVVKPFVALFKRFHLTIFFIFVIGCLAGAVLLVNDILTKDPDDPSYASSISAGKIDQATLQHIQSLHTSEAPGATPELPAGRVNPFNE
jgi:hypothetical protein